MAIAAQGEGGGEPAYDPGNGFVKIENSILRNNKGSSRGSGGLFLWLYGDDEALIENSIIQGNSVIRGGIYNDSKAGGVRVGGSGGKVAIRGTAIANNTAQHQGGGIWTDADSIEIEDSTFS